MKRCENRSGFGLIELLFSVALCALVIWVVGGGFQLATGLGTFSKNRYAAVNDAEKMMEEVRRLADAAGLSGSGSVEDATYWTAWIAGQSFSTLPSPTRTVSFSARNRIGSASSACDGGMERKGCESERYAY